MFLNNYYTRIAARNSGSGSAIGVKQTNGSNGNFGSLEKDAIAQTNWNATYFYNFGTMAAISNNTTAYWPNNTSNDHADCYGVIIGDGDTAPAYDDYTLSGNQITSFTASSALSQSVADGKITITASYLITNTGASAFTIKEIALSAGTGNMIRALLTHDLLEIPLTIQPNETKTLIYKLVFDYT